MEDPVHAVFVIGRCKDVRDDESAAPGDYDRVVAKIGVLEQNTRVFFMNTDGVLDSRALTCTVDERGAVDWLAVPLGDPVLSHATKIGRTEQLKDLLHVVDCPFAITAQRQAVGHVPSTIFSQIKSVFPLMRVFRVSVRNHHLRQ